MSRSLAACEGALLVVDAAQGVEAQTLANVYLALENDLEASLVHRRSTDACHAIYRNAADQQRTTGSPRPQSSSWRLHTIGHRDEAHRTLSQIIPVINKVDLPAADPERVMREIEEVIGLDCLNAVLCSAKSGLGVTDVLEAVVQRIPPPKADEEAPLRALIFDSYYDEYRGVIVYFRVVDGVLRAKDVIRFMNTKCEYEITGLGVMSPYQTEVTEGLPSLLGSAAHASHPVLSCTAARNRGGCGALLCDQAPPSSKMRI